jgi:ABC-type branched-subunit amino acid transport system substrate-binding protein
MAEQTSNGIFWTIGIVLIALGLIYASVVEAPVQVIKIGILKQESSTELQKVYELALNNTETEGRKIQLEPMYFSGECEGENLQFDIEEFLSESGVKIVLGNICDASDSLVATVTQEQGVVLVSSAVPSDDHNFGDLVFHISSSQENLTEVLASHEALDGSTRAAVVFENKDTSIETKTKLKEVYEGWYLFEESYESDQTDFTSTVATILSVNPDTVFLIAESQETSTQLLAKLKEAGSNIAFYGTDALINPVALLENPSLYEGVIFPVTVAVYNEDFIKMYRLYQETFGFIPEQPTTTAVAFDSVHLIVDAFESGAQKPNEIADFLTHLSGWSGSSGLLTFDESRVIRLPYRLVQAVDGRLVEVSTKK